MCVVRYLYIKYTFRHNKIVLLAREIKTARIETSTWDSGGGQKGTKSDDVWLTAIVKIYHRNLVGLISAKHCSNAK